jgi:hypothetical protein
MALSDILFETLDQLEALERLGPDRYDGYNPAEFQRLHEQFYRMMINSMRILQLHSDQFPPVNDVAFFERAMHMIREDDQRPWEVLREELKAELQRPILIPPDDQGRRIDVDSSTSASRADRAELPSDESRQIHIPDDDGPNSEPHA